MPLQILSAQVQPNTTKNFIFADTIVQRMVGISAFSLSYGNKDHHVQTVSISLSVNQQGNTLSVIPHATLVDSSGNNLDPGASSISVVAVAYVGIDPNTIKFGNAGNIPNGGTSGGIVVPCTSPRVLQSALAGYNLSFGASDHHMETAAAAVGSQLSGTSATITGQAQMYDDNGHSASIATVDGGLLASCDDTLGMYVVPTDSLQGSGQVLAFPSGPSHYVALLSGFRVQYRNNSDHHVKTIAADLVVQSTSGNNVTVTGKATLTDNSGNTQDDSVSNVNGFVIGY